LGDGASELGESDSREFLSAYFKAQDLTAEGVSKGVLNELAVTGVGSPLAVNTGSAICYGLYVNTASVNLAVSTPSLGTTGGRVILQTNWGGTGGASLEARTRLKILINSDGVAAIPALTQAFGTTWEISLYTFTITTGGVITLTDDRTYRKITAMVDEAEIMAEAVTTGKIAPLAVTTAKIANENVTAAKIENRTRRFLALPREWNSINPNADAIISAQNGYGTESGAAGTRWDNIHSNFFVPDDFVSTLTVSVIMGGCTGTGNVKLTASGIGCKYGAVGENWTNHSQNWSSVTIAVVSGNLITVLDTVTLANANKGDFVSIQWERAINDVGDTAGTVYIMGFLISYTADS
jgi:hypothetical protein